MLLGFVVAETDMERVRSRRGVSARTESVIVGVLGLLEFAVLGIVEPTSWTRRRAVNISSSVKRPNGSRLLRIVPEKRVGSATNQPGWMYLDR